MQNASVKCGSENLKVLRKLDVENTWNIFNQRSSCLVVSTKFGV